MLLTVFFFFQDDYYYSFLISLLLNLIAHKITSQMFYVNWSDQTCQEIDCQYRALSEIVSFFVIKNIREYFFINF